MALAITACGSDDAPPPTQDLGPAVTDAGPDAGVFDAMTEDSGAPDGGEVDAGSPDSGTPDMGPPEPQPLVGGAPLSSAAPTWPTRTHAQLPSTRWESSAAPLPTNGWWQNAVVGPGVDRIWTLPYQARVEGGGLFFGLPELDVTDRALTARADLDLGFGAGEAIETPKVVEHDLLSVTMRWLQGTRSLTTPLVRGMPYVTGQYADLIPRVFTSRGLTSINGMTPGATVTGDRFVIRLGNGQEWRLYASSPLSFRTSANELIGTARYSGSIRAAIIPAGQGPTLDAHAARIPVGGDVSAEVQGDMGTIEFRWRTTGTGPLLMARLPHHAPGLSGVSTTTVAYATLRGEMIGVTGDAWTLSEALTTIDFRAPAGIDPRRDADLRAALRQDRSLRVRSEDPYFGGKELALLARHALIADELGETAIATEIRQNLQADLEPWLRGSNPDPLAYDQTWGGLVLARGINDAGAAFGQGWYNDHHFHYGYFVYAFAVLAAGDPTWKDRWGDHALHFVRDFANPSSEDPHYPVTRSKDWFVGHSWAAGLFPFPDGRNQESTSEAVNAWYGVYLYGLATGDDRLRDLGRILLATELRSSWTYWQMRDQDTIYPPVFAANKAVGILWSGKVEYRTFFGDNVEFIHGIQMLPFTPISEDLLRRSWIEEEYPVFATALTRGGLEEGWRGFIIMADGILDADRAWTDAQTLTAYDNGNSRTNTLYWLATRPR